MKRFFPLVFFTSLALFSSGHPDKYALCITVGNYQSVSRNIWDKTSANNDWELIKKILPLKGFSNEKIYLLKDSDATKLKIESGLDNLKEKVSTGDNVLIYVSALGELLVDDNGDEADGLDEAIVPYNAVYSADPMRYKEFEQGYLRDDILKQKIADLEKGVKTS